VFQVITEAIRLFPPPPVNIREAINEIDLVDSHVLPKGATIDMPTYTMHRDPMHFLDPERFDPERFSPQKSLGRHPYAYIPLELGRRICAGYVFAIMEAKIIVSTVLRRYCITEIEGGIKGLEEKLKLSFVMSPANGIRVKIFLC
jgi:cytochrome P450